MNQGSSWLILFLLATCVGKVFCDWNENTKTCTSEKILGNYEGALSITPVAFPNGKNLWVQVKKNIANEKPPVIQIYLILDEDSACKNDASIIDGKYPIKFSVTDSDTTGQSCDFKYDWPMNDNQAIEYNERFQFKFEIAVKDDGSYSFSQKKSDGTLIERTSRTKDQQCFKQVGDTLAFFMKFDKPFQISADKICGIRFDFAGGYTTDNMKIDDTPCSILTSDNILKPTVGSTNAPLTEASDTPATGSSDTPGTSDTPSTESSDTPGTGSSDAPVTGSSDTLGTELSDPITKTTIHLPTEAEQTSIETEQPTDVLTESESTDSGGTTTSTSPSGGLETWIIVLIVVGAVILIAIIIIIVLVCIFKKKKSDDDVEANDDDEKDDKEETGEEKTEDDKKDEGTEEDNKEPTNTTEEDGTKEETGEGTKEETGEGTKEETGEGTEE